MGRFVDNNDKNNMLKKGQFAIIYPFIYDKNKVSDLLKKGVLVKRNLDESYTKFLFGYAIEILHVSSENSLVPSIVEYKNKNKLKNNVISTEYSLLNVEDEYFILCEDNLSFMVEVFEPIKDISYGNYIGLHYLMTTLRKENKGKISIFSKKDEKKLKISYVFKSKNKDKYYSSKNITCIKTKNEEYVIRYELELLDNGQKLEIDEEQIDAVAEKYSIDNKSGLLNYFQKELNKRIIENKISIERYIEKIIDEFCAEKFSNFLSSYHIVDNGDKELSKNFMISLVQYRRNLSNDGDLINDYNTYINKISNNITTYSGGSVVVHYGRNIFLEDSKNGKNLSDSYKKSHFYVYLIVIVQFFTLYNLIRKSIFQKYDKENYKKIKNIKKKSLNFLSYVNFERISHHVIYNSQYLFYRKNLNIDNMKNEVETTIEKIDNEIEQIRSKRLNRWLFIITVATTFGALSDIYKSSNAIVNFLKMLYLHLVK